MSHDPTSSHHGPPPREFTNIPMWFIVLVICCLGLVWWFAAWFKVGTVHGRDAGEVLKTQVTAAEPDHAALIADASKTVLARGEIVYAERCASCHGADGYGISSDPTIRKFSSEPFKAPYGGGVYGIYLTLTNGWGKMTSVKSSVSAEDRYAVTHYIREAMVKTKNPANYVADSKALLASLPKKGAAGAADIDPRTVVAPRAVHALMADAAQTATARQGELTAWLNVANLASSARAQLLSQLETQSGVVDRLHRACVAGDVAAQTGLLSQIMPLSSTTDVSAIRASLLAALGVAP